MPNPLKSREVPKSNPQSLSTKKTIDFAAVAPDEFRMEVKARCIHLWGEEGYAQHRDNIIQAIQERNVPVVSFTFFEFLLAICGVQGYWVAVALVLEWQLEANISDYEKHFDAWLTHLTEKQKQSTH